LGGGFIRYFFSSAEFKRAPQRSRPRKQMYEPNLRLTINTKLRLYFPPFFIRQKRLLLERRLAPSPLFKASLGPFAAPGSAHSASLPQNRRKSDSRRRPAPGGGGAAAPVGARERLSRKGTGLKPRATFYDLNCSRAEQ